MVISAFLYGVAVGRWELFPYTQLRAAFDQVRLSGPELSVFSAPDAISIDVQALTNLETFEDVEALRRGLTEFLWDAPSIPTGMLPTTVATNTDNSEYQAVTGFSQIERLESVVIPGIVGVGHLLRSTGDRSCLMVYVEGTDGPPSVHPDALSAFLDWGCDVLAVALPLHDLGYVPVTIDHPRYGLILLDHIDRLALFVGEPAAGIRFIIEPILRAMNHVTSVREYEKIGITGFSAGGWAATVYAALDPRMQRSYAVAGCLPIALAMLPPRPTTGLYFHRDMALYSRATYLDLYGLAASGEGRGHVQILSKFDSCCFPAVLAESYAGNWRRWSVRSDPVPIGLWWTTPTGATQLRPSL